MLADAGSMPSSKLPTGISASGWRRGRLVGVSCLRGSEGIDERGLRDGLKVSWMTRVLGLLEIVSSVGGGASTFVDLDISGDLPVPGLYRSNMGVKGVG